MGGILASDYRYLTVLSENLVDAGGFVQHNIDRKDCRGSVTAQQSAIRNCCKETTNERRFFS